jgi:hypothetical protein
MNYLLAKAFNIGDQVILNDNKATLSTAWGQGDGIGKIISIILQYSISIASIIFVALLIFGGITFIINAGNSDQKKSAQSKQTITSALIGFIIVIFAYLIILVIQKFTGLPILNSNL